MKKPKTYLLARSEIIKLAGNEALIMRGDTIYVTSTLLADRNRLINQLLPGLDGIKAAGSCGAYLPP